MPAPTVAFELYDAVFQYMDDLGYSELELCGELNIKSKKQFNINGRIPLSLFEQVFLAAEDLTEDLAVGMHMGAKMYPKTMGVFYFLSVAGENLTQIMDAIQKYLPLAYDFIQLEMSTDEENLKIELDHGNHQPHRHVMAYLLTHWYATANNLTFDTQNVPRTLYLKSQQACSDNIIQAVFNNTDVRFNQEKDGFDLSLSALNYHTPLTNQNAFRWYEKQAATLLMRLRSQDRIAREISSHVMSMLGSGAPGIEDVAKKMNCSGRTLQRRLSERNLSYQMLLDSIRSELAIKLLSTTSLPITHIAEQTGFSDDSTFHRAFKRWTGEPPSHFRH